MPEPLRKRRPTVYMRSKIWHIVDALAPEVPTQYQQGILSRESLILRRGPEYYGPRKENNVKGKELQSRFSLNLEDIVREGMDGGKRYVYPKSEVEEAVGWWWNQWRPMLLEELKRRIENSLERSYDLSGDLWWPIAEDGSLMPQPQPGDAVDEAYFEEEMKH